MGLHAGFSYSLSSSKRYFIGLIIITVLSTLINLFFTLVVSIFTYKDICERQEWSIDCDSEEPRIIYLVVGLLSLGITLCICSGCICCARLYYRALLEENVYLYDKPEANQAQYHGTPGESIFVNTDSGRQISQSGARPYYEGGTGQMIYNNQYNFGTYGGGQTTWSSSQSRIAASSAPTYYQNPYLSTSVYSGTTTPGSSVTSNASELPTIS